MKRGEDSKRPQMQKILLHKQQTAGGEENRESEVTIRTLSFVSLHRRTAHCRTSRERQRGMTSLTFRQRYHSLSVCVGSYIRVCGVRIPFTYYEKDPFSYATLYSYQKVTQKQVRNSRWRELFFSHVTNAKTFEYNFANYCFCQVPDNGATVELPAHCATRDTNTQVLHRVVSKLVTKGDVDVVVHGMSEPSAPMHLLQ